MAAATPSTFRRTSAKAHSLILRAGGAFRPAGPFYWSLVKAGCRFPCIDIIGRVVVDRELLACACCENWPPSRRDQRARPRRAPRFLPGTARVRPARRTLPTRRKPIATPGASPRRCASSRAHCARSRATRRCCWRRSRPCTPGNGFARRSIWQRARNLPARHPRRSTSCSAGRASRWAGSTRPRRTCGARSQPTPAQPPRTPTSLSCCRAWAAWPMPRRATSAPSS